MFDREIQTTDIPKKELCAHWEDVGGSPEGWRESTDSNGKKGLEVGALIKGDCITYCIVPIFGKKGGGIFEEDDEEDW